MKIYFLGTSHAVQHMRDAAQWRGFELAAIPEAADLVFVSHDTPTDEQGYRDLDTIYRLLEAAESSAHCPIILTSAVPPGWCRENAVQFHQLEMLRIGHETQRARHPEQLIVGSPTGRDPLPAAYEQYLRAWDCPILRMTYEEAELAKIAINMFLAAQVDTTNRLAAAALKVGARWDEITRALTHDRRIGPHAYLTPGRWQDSPHLLRDAVTLAEIEGR